MEKQASNGGRDIVALATDYADGVAAGWDLDARGAEALRDLVLDAVTTWTVEDIDQAGDRCAEAADAAAPIYYSDQAALLVQTFSLSMVNRGVADIGVQPFDPTADDFYQWTCANASAGWCVTLSAAMTSAVCGLVTVPGLVALGLSEDAAEVAARLVADRDWDGNLAGLHLSATLLAAEEVTA